MSPTPVLPTRSIGLICSDSEGTRVLVLSMEVLSAVLHVLLAGYGTCPPYRPLVLLTTFTTINSHSFPHV